MSTKSAKKEKGVSAAVNFDPKLQSELEEVISNNAQEKTETVLDGVRGKVFTDRYSLKDAEGKSVEANPEQMWRRVAAGIAQVEKTQTKQKEWAGKFYNTLKDFKFVPGGRVLSGAGTPYEVTFYNCFVIPSPHDSRNGIIDNLKIMVDIMSRSGGVGINLSSLRPRGARVKKVNGTSSGPVNWAALYSTATHDVIQQRGTRRGALMLMLYDWHPDLIEFIEVKKDLSKINGANLSVNFSDAFMEAVKEDKDWDLFFPDVEDPQYDELWDGDIEKWLSAGKKVKVYQTLKAREIWDKVCHAAWASAEPGTHFIERSNKRSNTWYFEKLISTNPCGEQPLGAWAVCNLGAMNLTAFIKGELGMGKFDYDSLAEHVKVAIRFMDNVVDATGYYFEENKKQQMGIRRTGLGTMGLGDAIRMGIRYGSEEAFPVVEKIYKTIRDAAYEVSAQLSAEKGAFSNYDKDKYLEGWFIKRLPDKVRDAIAKNGIRNAVILTQAPTGTTSLLSGVSSGIEPVYDFAMVRKDRTGEHTIYHPLYQEWKEAHPDSEHPSYFVSANDLTPEEHVRMQALIQDYTDSSISKTVNAPNAHSVEDVKRLYTLAYELGAKGVTYMRDGSREGVLSHIEEKKDNKAEVSVGNGQSMPVLRKRPDYLHGVTRRIATPVGHAFVTINADEAGDPFEVFINVGKAGSDILADAEAMGRLVSLALRIPSSYAPKEVAAQVASQLRGICGANQLGFGSNRISSLADAVAKVMNEYLSAYGVKPVEETSDVATNGNGKPVSSLPSQGGALNGNGNGNGVHNESKPLSFGNGNGIKSESLNLSATNSASLGESQSGAVVEQAAQPMFLSGAKTSGRDICPKCGVASFVSEEGCKKCYSCGHSEC